MKDEIEGNKKIIMKEKKLTTNRNLYCFTRQRVMNFVTQLINKLLEKKLQYKLKSFVLFIYKYIFKNKK